MKFNLILPILFILILTSVNAFSTFGTTFVEADCFNPGMAEFGIKNLENSTQKYVIEAIEETADWINLNGLWIKDNKLIFTLEPNETKALYGFIKPLCNTEPGEYIVALKIRENDNSSLKNILVKVLDSRKIILDLNKSDISITQCEKAEFPISIKNNSKGNEIIEVVVDGLPQAWTAYTEEFPLEKGKTADKTLWVLPTCTAKVKDYEFKVTAAIKGTNFYDEKTAKLTIDDAQNVYIEDKAFVVCNELKENGTVIVKNLGLKKDLFHFKVENLGKTSVTTADVELNPNEGIAVNILFDKVEGTGADKVNFRVQSATFDKEYSKIFDVNKENCFDAAVNVPPFKKVSITAGKERVDKVKVKNTGTKSNTVKLEVSGPAWVTTIPKNVELQSKETGEFFIYYNPAMDMQDSNYKVKITLKAEDFYKTYNVDVVVNSASTFVQQAVKIESSVKEVSSDNKVTAILLLTNDSNTNVMVKSISASDLNILFDPASLIIPKNSSKEVKVIIYLAEMQDIIKVPLKIETDKGLIEKELEINTTNNSILSVGFFTIFDGQNIFAMPLLAAIVIVIFVIFIFYRKANKAGKEDSGA
ncbi:MAG: hypothetical protein AABW72_02865 [archaeon]